MIRNVRCVDSYDIAKDVIEKDVGDKWNRVPHLIANDFDKCLVLYFPNSQGFWDSCLVESVKDALRVIDNFKEMKEELK